MSRYLTPGRIALLALITLYSDGLVPSSATVPVLSFTISYLLPVHSRSDQREDDIPLDDFPITIEKLQEATILHISAIPGRTVWDLLLNNMWAINSLDALHAFFDALPSLLEKPIEESLIEPDELDPGPQGRMLLSRNSPLGAFVRRSQLEFTRLQFHDGNSLWKSFIVYRDPTSASWKRRNAAAGLNSFDSNLQHDRTNADGALLGLVYGDLSDNITKNSNNSTDDMEKLLDYQVTRMQQIGVRIPHAVQSQLRRMAKPGSVVPDVLYYMHWLNQFGRTHPGELTAIQKKGILGSEKEALSFLMAKAKESNMWALLSGTLLSEAKIVLSNGESVSQAFESIVKASYINITKDTVQSYGSQWLMQSSIFDRLGVGCQAWIHSELFLHCGSQNSAAEDVMQSQCRSAHMVKSGAGGLLIVTGANESSSLLERVVSTKHSVEWMSDELNAGEQVLTQLRAAPADDQELQHRVSLIEIELKMRRGDYSSSLSLLENTLSVMNRQKADILQRLRAMVLKARIYDKAGIPQKGFSVALRAASLAYKARILPVLWEAVGAVCKILVSVKEFDAAVKLLESVLPQALECEDCELAAFLYSSLADGLMGLAGQAQTGTLQRKEWLNKTSESLDRAFDEYSRIEDIRGQCETLAKRATIMHLNGDSVLANDCAAKYLDIKRAARAQS
ncbi:MAG: hypothetical protein Q9170_001906 [Blastenia crenularia]